MPDFNRLWLSAEHCSAAYIPEEDKARAALAALGSSFLGRYCDDRHQALAYRDKAGEANVAISGTRMMQGTLAERLGDLAEDIYFRPLDLGGGIKVATGAHDGLGLLWAWALAIFANDATISVQGHSLGGERVPYTPLFLPAARIGRLTAFEPPKPANAAFWARYADELFALSTIAHGRDPWFHWPPAEIAEGLQHQPGETLIWLNGGTWSWMSEAALPAGDLLLHAADHDVGAVSAALRLLAEAAA